MANEDLERETAPRFKPGAEWRTMGSAPRNGTVVLGAYRFHGRWLMGSVYRQYPDGQGNDYEGFWVQEVPRADGYICGRSVEPLYWLPLPGD